MSGEPGHGAHRIEYAFPVTDELTAWMKQNAAPFDQSEFATFLEEHAAELAAPSNGERAEFESLFKAKFATPAELIALSRDLEVHVAGKWKQGVRLQSGERVVEVVEEHMNGKGEPITVPGLFMVSVAAFLDGENVRIPARLRYRIAGGSIVWFYQLYRPEFWIRARVRDDLAKAADATNLPAFEGAPEA